MNKTVAIIIEDELPAARLLSKMLMELRPEWDVMTLPGSIEESVEWFNNHTHPDILFLDIQLSDGNSFLLIEQAHPECMIIFTTAYDEYALRAFSVNSIDYLLKPIHSERLEEAILKFENLTSVSLKNNIRTEQIKELIHHFAHSDKIYRTRFLVSGNEKFYTLQVDEVAYFYSENKFTFAVTRQNKEHVIDLSLDKLKEQLDPDVFFRINRQILINIHAIEKIEPYFQNKVTVHMLPPFKEQLVVSREKVSDFKRWLNY
jgi:DNA-binding LytR/AlgR family response regulator